MTRWGRGTSVSWSLPSTPAAGLPCAHVVRHGVECLARLIPMPSTIWRKASERCMEGIGTSGGRHQNE
ncbi:MAG: hypothetical protein K6E15_01590 [Prevotella sp.]|nr:hypothetical protein [Prevotella sp.]